MTGFVVQGHIYSLHLVKFKLVFPKMLLVIFLNL